MVSRHHRPHMADNVTHPSFSRARCSTARCEDGAGILLIVIVHFNLTARLLFRQEEKAKVAKEEKAEKARRVAKAAAQEMVRQVSM